MDRPAARTGGINGLDISAGITMQAAPLAWMYPSAASPQGTFIDDAGAVKKAVRIPVIGVGKIRDPWFAEKILEERRTDFVALGRTLIADPEWPRKAAEGKEREIRRCISCNRCLAIMYRRPVRCTVNARAGLEREFPLIPCARPRRVAVVGGGPAGLEAARIAAERGHRVTLFEKERSLGGQLRLAAVPPFKKDLAFLLSYLKSGVKEKAEIQVQTEADPGTLLQGGFDSVVVATGAAPSPPSRDGEVTAVLSWEILGGKAKIPGVRVAVLGNGRVACETSEFLALRRRKEVTLIHAGPLEEIGCDLEPLIERRLLMERLVEAGVRILYGTRVVGMTPEGVRVEGRESGLIPCDHVVVDEPPRPRGSLLQELQGKVKVIAIGDCVEPRDLYKAIHEGFRAGYSIE